MNRCGAGCNGVSKASTGATLHPATERSENSNVRLSSKKSLPSAVLSQQILKTEDNNTNTNKTKKVNVNTDKIVLGSKIEKLSDAAVRRLLKKTNVFAKLSPIQKSRIVQTLEKAGNVVGYMGDGINDVPALHAADVSLSVDNAVDVARESADFVLIEKSLSSLNRGIKLGRTTFSNTLKYIMVTTSANFGNMFSMAGMSIFLPFLPLLPKQILLINFLTDFPAITVAGDRVDAEILTRPRRWNIRQIMRFMFVFGIISSVFDYITFGVLFVGFKVSPEIFRSSWFIFSVITELLILMVMRTQKPFFRSRPSPALLYSSVAVGVLTVMLPYTPLRQALDISAPGPVIVMSLIAISAAYIVTTEIAKHFFYRHEK